MTYAMQLAIKKAAEAGLAWVGTFNGNHAGCAAVYSTMPLAHDMVGMYMTVANGNHMPPWGGVERILGTNPISIAIPAGKEPPVALDIATTVAAAGKVKLAAQKGEAMPIGWMIDRKGQPLTDPKRSSEGFLLPIGGYKGYGLNVVIGMLAGVLNGAAYGRNVIDFTQDVATRNNSGHMILAMRVDNFQPAHVQERDGSRDPRIRESERMEEWIASGCPARWSSTRFGSGWKGIPVNPPSGAAQTVDKELQLPDRLE
jgi:LDH2 family malate/lactate/ureidoglycolate dehydrogenase